MLRGYVRPKFLKNNNMKKIFIIAAIHCLSISTYSIAQPLVKKVSDPKTNFNYLWNYFDKHYALFEVKNINWDDVRKKYELQINSQTNDSVLFKIFSDMLGVLDDHHVNLFSEKEQYNSGNRKGKKDFDFDIISKKYLHGTASEQVLIPVRGGKFRSLYKTGMIDKDIVYLNINGFRSGKESIRILDSLLEKNLTTKGFILDIRNNGGGDDELAKVTIERLATEHKQFLQIRFRYGSRHSDYTTTIPWYVVPKNNTKFKNQIVLVTNSNTASAAENFELGMRTLSNVTIIGDTTTGVFATTLEGELPNGWKFSCSNSLYTDQNGICYEGKGIAPDYFVTNSPDDLSKGNDLVLEKAIQFLKDEVQIKKVRSADKIAAKNSIATYIRNNLEVKDNRMDIVTKECDKIMATPNAKYYYDDYEMFLLLLEQLGKKGDDATILSTFMSRHIQKSVFATFIKTINYVYVGKENKATAIISKILKEDKVEEMLYAAGMLDNVANTIFRSGNEKAAFYFFDANIKLHPTNPNVYESVGDVYVKKGNKQEAKKYYDVFLKFEPENKRILKKILGLAL